MWNALFLLLGLEGGSGMEKEEERELSILCQDLIRAVRHGRSPVFLKEVGYYRERRQNRRP